MQEGNCRGLAAGVSRRELGRLMLSGAWAAGLLWPASARGQAMARLWDEATQLKYSRFMLEFTRQFEQPIDCADRALRGLIEFAARERLPVRLFYFGKVQGRPKRKWYSFKPGDDKERTAALLMRQLGAVNVIDNSALIRAEELRPGDMIMTRFQDVDSTGHTRIVVKSIYDQDQRDWLVAWMQGNLPPTIPVEKEEYFRDIPADRGTPQPRRWRFNQFVVGG
jgi:hypothetical protein